ncbi:hypothetical protein, partial [Amycolatopsis sp.]|uniref:hypothetical protein n=1 Tax=Amycolatopsis sp. TaxID=37632 RepID=UPI002E024672|nr:hypothetical protein [Amycolatopsis sp.]
MTHNRRPKTVAAVRPGAAYQRAKSQFADRAGDKPGRWYDIRNITGTAVIYLFDEIGYWGINAQDFVRDLTELDGV